MALIDNARGNDAKKNKAAMFLIKHGADLSLKNKGGEAAMHLAANPPNFLITKHLVEAGADINIIRKNGGNGDDYSPLHVAAKAGSVSICALLIDRGASRDIKNDEKRNPLAMCLAEEKKALIDPGSCFFIPNPMVVELLKTYVAGANTYAEFAEKDLMLAEHYIQAIEVAKEEVDFSMFVGHPLWHEREARLALERQTLLLQGESEIGGGLVQIEQATIPLDELSSVVEMTTSIEGGDFVAAVEVTPPCGDSGNDTA